MDFFEKKFVFVFLNSYHVFGRFVTRGVQKRDKNNRAKISSASKKSTYLLTSLLFFSTAPLPGWVLMWLGATGSDLKRLAATWAAKAA
jgi:hypothetical protein